MAILTFGTNANNSIPTGLQFLPGLGSGMSAADIATVEQAIIGANRTTGRPKIGGRFDSSGFLDIPGRGFLYALPGDYVLVDSRGWPILLSADTVANGLWTHS